MGDKDGSTYRIGINPFKNFYIEQNGRKDYISEIYPTYDWVENSGYENLGDWVEKSAQKVGI